MEEATFITFETFDFDHNESFLEGWKMISKSIDSTQEVPEFVQAKVFFFNKNVAKMDYEQYIKWKNKNSCQAMEYKQNGNITHEKIYSLNNAEAPINLQEVVHVKPAEVNNSHCNIGIPTNLTETSKKHGKEPYVTTFDARSEDYEMSQIVNEAEMEYSLSLADLAEILQNSKPIPGLRSLNIHPSNAEPTPSTLSRRLKPWETTALKSDFPLPHDKINSSARDPATFQHL